MDIQITQVNVGVISYDGRVCWVYKQTTPGVSGTWSEIWSGIAAIKSPLRAPAPPPGTNIGHQVGPEWQIVTESCNAEQTFMISELDITYRVIYKGNLVETE